MPTADLNPAFTHFLHEFWLALGGQTPYLDHLQITGEGGLASAFPVTDFATAAIAAAHLAVAELIEQAHGTLPPITVDRRLASFWFSTSLQPQGWSLPAQWDAVAGDYRAADGWIRLHTNAPHHRQAALSVLKTAPERDAVSQAVLRWKASELESAVVDNRGCAAAMRSASAWRDHTQGRAVAAEPLLHRVEATAGPAASHQSNPARPEWIVPRERPLHGIRVLDLTRILAGPVATRFLAGFGADVLRIDPPGWDEPGTVPEVVLGKRCARLDLRDPGDRAVLEGLLSEADVMIHGYRADALARLGLSAERRRALNPGLVDVSLNAYGWTGPWRERRGFDSLVQMSCGIADAGRVAARSDRPVPLPVQALDHATGYLMAAAAVRGLTQRLTTGQGVQNQASLARTALSLMSFAPTEAQPTPLLPLLPLNPSDYSDAIEHTAWGPALRLKSAGVIEGTPTHWDLPASALGSADARWQ
ncbi:CoA transferase [Pseudomonas petrae]|uniref:CoA transferase n=1 Tax=Pseudomonas petrae TaxID=2912190 RepID=A0ABS9I305_9PSED|nr:CoA transferase [Pseudomonas petrae]MCF7534917.1 CoA transferase [Pseudomonas petrae]MCF7538249.1 CoA transferase [Pseudomonas petrae]MCF7542167.1 CoA transferase [Pseudomonas petrae]MCF7555612.1 CoA transferase [Pseudomonas petrae]